MDARVRVRPSGRIDSEEPGRYVQARGRICWEIGEVGKSKRYRGAPTRPEGDYVGDADLAVPGILYFESESPQLINEVALRHAVTPSKPS